MRRISEDIRMSRSFVARGRKELVGLRAIVMLVGLERIVVHVIREWRRNRSFMSREMVECGIGIE